jgi:glc operon protein GlcG
MITQRGLAILATLLATAGISQAQIVEKKALTLAGAKKAAAAAVAEAMRNNAPGGVIAVVDDGGHPIYLERLDNTFSAGANISIGKARTAVMFRRPTKVFEDIVNKGRTTMVALPDFTPLQGGVPIIVDGQVVGGIGVSGAASAQQDEEIAIAGASALQSSGSTAIGMQPVPDITYLDRQKVSAAFAQGAPLLEVPGYKVHASRRTAAGQAEVHQWETDVIYVVEGSATFVSGGSVVDGKETGPGEIRGREIRGGQSRRISKGDVVVVPSGVPHWFKAVQGPVLYFVVKPISMNGGAR